MEDHIILVLHFALQLVNFKYLLLDMLFWNALNLHDTALVEVTCAKVIAIIWKQLQKNSRRGICWHSSVKVECSVFWWLLYVYSFWLMTWKLPSNLYCLFAEVWYPILKSLFYILSRYMWRPLPDSYDCVRSWSYYRIPYNGEANNMLLIIPEFLSCHRFYHLHMVWSQTPTAQSYHQFHRAGLASNENACCL